MLATPLLVTAAVRYPLVTVTVTLVACVLVSARRPWRGGPLMVPPAVAGVTVGLPWWCSPLLAIVTAVTFLGFPARIRIGLDHVIAAALAALLALSWIFPAGEIIPGHPALLDMTQVAAGVAILSVCAAAPPSAKHLQATIVASGTAVAVAALLAGGIHAGRLQGFGLNPNYLGGLLALPTVVSFAVAGLRRAPLWALPGLVTLAVLVATQSRAALLGVLAGMIAVALPRGPRRSRPALSPVLAVLAIPVVVASVMLDAGGGARDAAELRRNNEARAQSAVLAVRLAAEHPLRGVGYGTFSRQAARSPEPGVYINTHNDYLRLASETGVVSTLLLTLLVHRAVRRAGDTHERVLTGVVTAFAIMLLFGNLLSNLAVSAPFWVCLGTLLGARHSQDAHGTAHPTPPPATHHT
ncbi:hypothetical protein GCM10017673_32050 [Streptosporangium violaceochromogenes]|nr:hypothetical protein GCM10017673_32050 [Streptosporangium violaceochromogenes]